MNIKYWEKTGFFVFIKSFGKILTTKDKNHSNTGHYMNIKYWEKTGFFVFIKSFGKILTTKDKNHSNTGF